LSNAEAALGTRSRPLRAGLVGLIAALSLCLVPGVADAAKGKKKGKGQEISVMTRNLYLGGDLGPALRASNVDQAIDAGGQIVNQVHATKFPSVRAALLAREILKQRPDVVGLQEVALWRTGPFNLAAALNKAPVATQVDPLAGDFLTELQNQLAQQRKKLGKKNKGKGKKGASAAAKKKKPTPPKYRLAVVKDEFDFELPVNNGSGGLAAANRNERLTMRDAILVRKGVKVRNPSSGTFNALLRVQLAGFLSIDVTRGWTAVNVKVRGRGFNVVNTHFEAFDSQASNPASNGIAYPKGGIRQAQAQQLVGPGGPANRKNTLLIGDLNSNVPLQGNQAPGDDLAFQTVSGAGFRSVAIKPPPFSCCISDPNLTVASPVGVDHVVDQIMANNKKIRFRKGAVTSSRGSGLWSSDHFGVASRLLTK
jgi:hypothetical protein